MSQTVSALLVGVVEQTSNRFFGSIGDSLNPLADAARRSKIEWIGVRYEEGATGSARPTLKLLLDRVAAKTDTTPWDKVTRERRRRDEMLDKQADLARSKDRIHPQAVRTTLQPRRRNQAPNVGRIERNDHFHVELIASWIAVGTTPTTSASV